MSHSPESLDTSSASTRDERCSPPVGPAEALKELSEFTEFIELIEIIEGAEFADGILFCSLYVSNCFVCTVLFCKRIYRMTMGGVYFFCN